MFLITKTFNFVQNTLLLHQALLRGHLIQRCRPKSILRHCVAKHKCSFKNMCTINLAICIRSVSHVSITPTTPLHSSLYSLSNRIQVCITYIDGTHVHQQPQKNTRVLMNETSGGTHGCATPECTHGQRGTSISY